MSDYDLAIIFSVVFAVSIFSGFLYLYADEPTIDYVPGGNLTASWDEPQAATGIFDVFDQMGILEDADGGLLKNVFISAIAVIGVIIIARYLRGQ